jgi:hypothetical protein
MPDAPPPEPPVAPAAAPPADPDTEPAPRDPAVVFEVVLADWLAVVLWFVVALGLIVTLLWGIALNLASVLTVVFAVGLVDWPAVVLVSLRARLLPLPLPEPACVFDVVLADWLAEVVWFVVPLGAIVTLLCGIALNCALVFTDVLALGAVDCPAVVLVLLPAWLVWATAAVLNAAKIAADMTVTRCLRIM